jgi:hypothetical protein
MMNKNSLPTIVLGVPLFLSALGCSSEAPVAAAEKDNWYLEPPAGETQTELVDPATYAPVVPERIAEAEEFLAEIGTSQISICRWSRVRFWSAGSREPNRFRRSALLEMLCGCPARRLPVTSRRCAGSRWY